MTFKQFLYSCRTFDPGSSEPRSIPEWEYINELTDAFDSHSRLMIVKSRQMMVTWIGCAFILYKALTDGPGIHLVLSKEERSAKELIDRIRFIYDFLPDSMKKDKLIARRDRIILPDLESKILCLPATAHAVRGLSPKTVLWDEMAFTNYDEDIWTAVKPAVDSGGQFIGISTPNGPSGTFARLIHDSDNGFFIHRLHYSANPERGKEWEISAKAGLSNARWRREQELSFEGAEGRVYDQFTSKLHIRKRIPIPGSREGVKLYRGIDFGYRRPAVVWAEEDRNGTLTVFDSLLGDRWQIDRLISQIRIIDKRHNLNERDYSWTAVDPAGAANSDSGISPVEGLKEAGIKAIWRHSHIAPGVEAVRSLLLDASGNVNLRVHHRCFDLIKSFESYNWSENEEVPIKDGENDHLMDALRYLVVNLPRFQKISIRPLPKVVGLPSTNR